MFSRLIQPTNQPTSYSHSSGSLPGRKGVITAVALALGVWSMSALSQQPQPQPPAPTPAAQPPPPAAPTPAPEAKKEPPKAENAGAPSPVAAQPAPEAKKPEEKKPEPPKPAPAPAPEVKKEEPKKPEPKKEEPAKKPEEKKPEPPKPAPAPAPEVKKEEPKKPEPKKEEPAKKPEEKKPEPPKPAATPTPTAAPAPAPAAEGDKKLGPPKPDAPKPKPEAPPAAAAGKPKEPAKPQIEIRPAQLKDDKPASGATLGAKEQKILQQVRGLSAEQVREMANVYARLGNRLMTGLLVAELQRRNPNDTSAQELIKQMEEASLTPDDPEAVKAEELHMAGKPADAAALYQKLKNEKYAGRPFRYQQDLAYALLESGQEQAASAAFRELLGQKGSSKEEKADAARSLSQMALDAILKKGQNALTAKDARRAMEVAKQLLEKNPDDPDGVALKAAALALQGRPEAAVNYLMDLKASSRDPVFRHQKALADAFYDARDFDAAGQAYEAVIADARYSAEDRADAKLRLKDLARDRLILVGEQALKRRNFAEAERIAAQLEAERPVHPDSRAFRAQILARQHRHEEALAILEDLKARSRAGEPFDANSDLAEAYMNTGKWEAAAEEFTVAENDVRQDDVTRFEAARLGREMRSRYRPTITSVYEAQREEEGSIWRNTTEASTGVFGDGKNIFFLRTSWDQVDLSNERIVAKSNAERWQAEVAYRRLISHGFFGEVSVGGSDDDVVYGAKIGKYEAPGLAWELGFRGNDRATDSLQLEALNGRQNSLALYIGSHFSRRFYLDARFYFRQVDVRGHDLGEGWGLDMNVGYTLLEETRNRPELALSYFAEISYFNRNRLPDSFVAGVLRKGFTGNLEEALIDERINRHGVFLTLSKQLNHRINAYIYGGVAYEFEHGEVEGRVGAGLEAQFSKNGTFYLGVDYTTSGNAGNRGNGVLSGTAGVRVSF